jgi:hypothetical protein
MLLYSYWGIFHFTEIHIGALIVILINSHKLSQNHITFTPHERYHQKSPGKNPRLIREFHRVAPSISEAPLGAEDP